MGKNGDEPGFEPLARGAGIGRYVVLNLLGRGGMGEVYAAFDPELDRKVAVKLLRARIENGVSMSEGRQRTLREAQAIARLAHPNVVVVYDVGTFREQVFIAMEFVDGHTASYWVQAQTRTWQEILKVYLAAGQGLQAAHEKGLVHRDFKPENVMVARNGEVRVMDFGLAREIEARPTVNGPVTTTTAKFGGVRTDGGTIVLHKQRADGPSTTTVGAVPVAMANDDGVVRELRDTDPSSAAADLFSARLTRTGAIMGTPAYMAPEQFFKAGTDARSDQFSFCVTLYEALYGERPFPGNNIQTLVGNIVQGNIRDAPPNTKVPTWVRKVLLRGLRPTAAERYPSMAEILAALKTDPRTKYRRIALGAALALVPLAVGFGVRQIVADRTIVCTDGADRLNSAWELNSDGRSEGPRQRKIHEAFLATGKTYAPDVYETVRRALSQYAHRWSDMYKETCEATHVRHDQSPEVLDLRMSCLRERLEGMRALTSVFAGATSEVVDNAVSAAGALTSLDRCSDVVSLRAIVKPPDDPTTRAKVNSLREKLADIKARFDAGQWKDALKEGPALVSGARSIGYPALTAETLALVGQMETTANRPQNAEKLMYEAFDLADVAHHDELRAEVATTLVFVVGTLQARFQDAQMWAATASAVLERIGGHDQLRAWLLNNVGCSYSVHHDDDAAVHALESASALKERILGKDSVDVGISESNLAQVLQNMGRYQPALGHIDRALAILQTRLGSDHPYLAQQLCNRGEILNSLGRYTEAREPLERASRIWERELGREAIYRSYALTGIGISYLGEGKPASALEPLERALKIRLANDVEPADRAETLFALARALWASGRQRDRARALAAQARAAYDSAARKPDSAEVDSWLAEHGSS
ncbi:MAG TPA: serine/threonine-protein kinase [Polyangia bacterium]|nr:serine/threonine-protein kinase [Polyangia bacterium]